MSLTRASGPVVDIGLDVVRVPVTGRYPLGARITTDKGEKLILVQANGAVLGKALVGLTGTPFDAQALTNEILTALTASQREALECGFCATSTAVADGELFWMCTDKPDSGETDFGALYIGAAVIGAQMATTPAAGTAGGIDDAAASGDYNILGFQQIGTVAGLGEDTDNKWSDLQIDPTIIP